jgi:hypothetical protein
MGPETRGGQLWDVNPAAVSRGENRLDILAIADDGQLVHREFHDRWRGPTRARRNSSIGSLRARADLLRLSCGSVVFEL